LPRTAFALLGPTASGKSRLALSLAERLPLEIVSLDSAQVYRSMDIGTAKPGPTERARVPHHLIDIVDPDQGYSTGRWRSDAISAVVKILDRENIPVLVGGTMLYYRALVGGLDVLPQADPQLRAGIDAEAAKRGWPALHAELAKVDPRSALRIAPGDSQRIQRALEVWRLTGKPPSALQGTARAKLPFHLKAFALVPADRGELHRRIAERFDAMLEAGLVDEVRSLRARYKVTAASPSMRAVGYRQAWEFLDGSIGEGELRSSAVAATRQLAKRQLTWLRSFT
jgi:tRNA dimethylallyltransferase